MNEFYNLIDKLNIEITPEIKDRLSLYYNYLLEYNEHTNITRITNEEDVYLKHFYDSLLITKDIDLNVVDNLLDIGSGAGFPGVVIKIFYPNVNVTVIDSNNKKCSFLKSLIEKLNIEVNIVNKRVEDLDSCYYNYFDIVTSRAVAFIDVIASLSLPFVKVNGKVVLYKGNIDLEKDILKDHYKEIGIKNYHIVNVDYLNNIRNLIILEKDKMFLEKVNYNQIIKRSNKWKQM